MGEFWDIYDAKKNKTGKVAERGVYKFKKGEYHIVVTGIIINSKGEILITKRAEHKRHGGLWECNGGSILKGETSIQGMIRELKEEIGVTAKEFIPLGIYIPSPAILSERIYVYLARGLSYGNAHPDEDEFLDYRETPLCQLIDMIMNDRISDGKTVFGLFKAAEYLRRQELKANG